MKNKYGDQLYEVPNKKDPMPLEEHCDHPKEQQYYLEYRGWHDGAVEIYCEKCKKRRIKDEPHITLHEDTKRYHPYYGIYDFKTKEWWIMDEKGSEARAYAEYFIRSYIYNNPLSNENTN